VTTRRPTPEDAGEGIALEGDLARFPLVEILQLMDLARATGRLKLERPGERGEIVLDRGRPIRAGTSAGSVRMGEILVHHGVVPRAVIDRALIEQRNRGARLGALLLGEGVVREPLIRALEETLRRVLYGFMLWDGGRFRFEAGLAPERDGLEPELELDSIILEGASSLAAPRHAASC
jgi:hypothetical protein